MDLKKLVAEQCNFPKELNFTAENLQLTPNMEMGDFCLPCFPFAKIMHKFFTPFLYVDITLFPLRPLLGPSWATFAPLWAKNFGVPGGTPKPLGVIGFG